MYDGVKYNIPVNDVHSKCSSHYISDQMNLLVMVYQKLRAIQKLQEPYWLVKIVRLRSGNCFNTFNVQITGNNPQPSSFSISDSQNQTVTLAPGSFTVSEVPVAGFQVSFTGHCLQTGPFVATGTISAGQHLTCIIRNVTP
jgi:hypothetical protein